MTSLRGRLVLPDRVMPGIVDIDGSLIGEVRPSQDAASGPYLAPGLIDLHLHGFGGHDAMGGTDAIAGMAQALLPRGVTAFLPTAVSAPLAALHAFAAAGRDVARTEPTDRSASLGFALEGPFLAEERRGAHEAAHLRMPGSVADAELGPLLDGLRLITIAPELPGAIELIGSMAARGVVVALGHSDATIEEAAAGFAAGARSTTHLFNAMSGIDHRAPGLAAAALADDRVAVELIADGHHVDPALWRLIFRAKPGGRVVLVSDAIAAAGTGDGAARLGDLEVEVRGGRVTLAGTDTLAGSAIALDEAVRNVVAAGIGLPEAIAAASRNPAALLGLADRGEIAVGRRADLVELDDDLRVVGVLLGGSRVELRRRAPAPGAGGGPVR